MSTLILDVLHQYHGYHTPGGVCRIRIFEQDGRPPVVLVTELTENQNTSITNMAEYLAAEVLETYLPEHRGQAEPFIWIEHYPGRKADEYALVTFSHYRPTRELRAGRWRLGLGEPDWRHVDLMQIEALIGGRLT